MFEDFSFSSPSSSRPARLAFDGDDRLMVDSDSALISPMSSRCPSPRSSSVQRFPRSLPRSRSSYFRSPPAPTSVPSAYDHKRLSIGTLTRKLHEHTIQNPPIDSSRSPSSPASPHSASSSKPVPGYFLTPPDTDHDDEGFFDSPSSHLSSPSLSPQPQSPFLSPTSVPADFFHHANASGDLDPPHDHAQDRWSVRAQRQQIARLQCNPADVDAIRRALLSEDDIHNASLPREDDCHPSSLPPQVSPRRRAATLAHARGARYRPHTGSGLAETAAAAESRNRRKSSAGALHASLSASRVEKSYQHGSARDHRNKSEQGLRRKSLVSAALASMVENA